MIEPCKYCLRPIGRRGMLSHVHFRHRSYVSREFSLNPVIWAFLWLDGYADGPPDLSSRALPAPRPGTRYGAKRKMLRGEKGLRWV